MQPPRPIGLRPDGDARIVGGDEVGAATESDPAWQALHAEREAVERALALAQAGQKFSRDPEAASAAM